MTCPDSRHVASHRWLSAEGPGRGKEQSMNRRIFKSWLAKKRGPIAVLAAALAAAASLGVAGCGAAVSAAPHARADQVPAAANGLGQLTGLLPRDQLTLESAIQVNLSNETVRLPLYPGIAYK